MIIKLKKKGKVVDFHLLCEERGVDPRLVRKGFDGIDMTAYAVISARVKNLKEAQELFLRFGEKLPVVYYHDGRTGCGSGVLLPENFNVDKVSHFDPVETPIRIKVRKMIATRTILCFSSNGISPGEEYYQTIEDGPGGYKQYTTQDVFANSKFEEVHHEKEILRFCRRRRDVPARVRGHASTPDR